MTAASIEFRNVSKRYGDVAAVCNLDFTIAAGTLVTLLGPSGCGKTTTLRLIAGLELPNDGAILIGGSDVSRVSARRTATFPWCSRAMRCFRTCPYWRTYVTAS